MFNSEVKMDDRLFDESTLDAIPIKKDQIIIRNELIVALQNKWDEVNPCGDGSGSMTFPEIIEFVKNFGRKITV